MPGKKKKQSSRPAFQAQDSMRRDIEAARAANLQTVSSNESGNSEAAEDGLDLADQLLATLNARDQAAADTEKARKAESSMLIPHPPSKSKSPLSFGSGHNGGDASSSASPRKGPGDVLKEAGEKIFGHHSSKSPPPVFVEDDGAIDSSLSTDMARKGSIRERLFGSSPNKEVESSEPDSGRQKVSRQKARKERKEAEARAQRLQAEEELKANGGRPDLAEKERVAITELCQALNVQMKEIEPDGHCLYAAVADQLNLHNHGSKYNYHDTRKAAAAFMRSHPDDFMPFISDSDEHMAGIDNKEAGSQEVSDASKQQGHFMKYCDAVESTGVWGGQPEILALSRAFKAPIHVIQAGSPVVKVATEESKGEPLMISYHRRMYGLGEHYNSLHKVTK